MRPPGETSRRAAVLISRESQSWSRPKGVARFHFSVSGRYFGLNRSIHRVLLCAICEKPLNSGRKKPVSSRAAELESRTGKVETKDPSHVSKGDEPQCSEGPERPSWAASSVKLSTRRSARAPSYAAKRRSPSHPATPSLHPAKQRQPTRAVKPPHAAAFGDQSGNLGPTRSRAHALLYGETSTRIKRLTCA